jgi:hypothetical protein
MRGSLEKSVVGGVGVVNTLEFSYKKLLSTDYPIRIRLWSRAGITSSTPLDIQEARCSLNTR